MVANLVDSGGCPATTSTTSCDSTKNAVDNDAQQCEGGEYLVSSIDTSSTNAGTATDERRFVWFHQEEEMQKKKLHDLRTNSSSSSTSYQYIPEVGALPASSRLESKDFKDKVRAGGGAKGRTGSTDFTRGKNAFVRPCTVGWKSQNQPLARGGGPRTPRQKG